MRFDLNLIDPSKTRFEPKDFSCPYCGHAICYHTGMTWCLGACRCQVRQRRLYRWAKRQARQQNKANRTGEAS